MKIIVNICALISLLSIIAFVLGIIKPSIIKCKTRGKVALLTISVFLLSAVIGSSFTPEEQKAMNVKNQTEKTNKEEISKEEKQKPKEIISSIGKEIEVGNFVYIINGFRYTKTIGNDIVGETADGIFLLVELTVTNISNETRTLDGSLFSVTDKDGAKFEHSMSGSTALGMSGGKTLFLKEFHPKIKTKGTLVFEVPSKGLYYMELLGSFWGTSSVKVPLKK